jgi:hypothetical protein
MLKGELTADRLDLFERAGLLQPKVHEDHMDGDGKAAHPRVSDLPGQSDARDADHFPCYQAGFMPSASASTGSPHRPGCGQVGQTVHEMAARVAEMHGPFLPLAEKIR